MVKQLKKYGLILISFTITLLLYASIGISAKIMHSKEANQTISIPITMNHTASREMIVHHKKFPPAILENSQHPIIYLTFDDGPNQHTKKILSILKSENIHATFFILQPNMKYHPEEIQQIIDDGHALGCHGVTHSLDAFYQTDTSPVQEMDTCSEAILELVDVDTNLVRTPYGSIPHLSLTQKDILESSGYEIWDWNVDSNDWQMHSTDQLIHHTMQQTHAQIAANQSPVILFHDKEVTANALRQVIKKLKALNAEFRALSDDYVPVQFHVQKE